MLRGVLLGLALVTAFQQTAGAKSSPTAATDPRPAEEVQSGARTTRPTGGTIGGHWWSRALPRLYSALRSAWSLRAGHRTPVLVITDDGRDVDDIEALTYLAGSRNLKLAGVITTHMIPDRRAMIARGVLNHLRQRRVPIGVGSIFPLGKEDESLVRYLREHTIDGRSYEGDGLIETFPDGVDLIQRLAREHGSNLQVVVLAPLTDLAKAIERDPACFAKLGGIYVQGQATVDERGRLAPDAAAYNLKEDEAAARIVFSLQDTVPFTLVGKHAAYQVPLTRDDLTTLARTRNPVGGYLLTHAQKGLECFARRAPEVFKRVFAVPAEKDALEALAGLNKLSNPYDALTVMALARPELFSPVQAGAHRLIGGSPESPGLSSAERVKRDLMDTMLRALRRWPF